MRPARTLARHFFRIIRSQPPAKTKTFPELCDQIATFSMQSETPKTQRSTHATRAVRWHMMWLVFLSWSASVYCNVSDGWWDITATLTDQISSQKADYVTNYQKEVFRHFSVSSLYVNALENSFFVRVHVSNGGHSEDTESPGASLCARKSKTAEACGVKKWLRLTNCPAVRDPHEVLLWHAGGRKPAQRSISIPIFRTIGCVFAAKIAKIQFSCIVLAMEHEIFYRFAWNWHM